MDAPAANSLSSRPALDSRFRPAMTPPDHFALNALTFAEGWPSPVDGTGLENRRPERVRGFESRPLRHFHFQRGPGTDRVECAPRAEMVCPTTIGRIRFAP